MAVVAVAVEGKGRTSSRDTDTTDTTTDNPAVATTVVWGVGRDRREGTVGGERF